MAEESGILPQGFSSWAWHDIFPVLTGPVYNVFMTGMRKNPVTYLQIVGLAVSFAIVLASGLLALILPMRLGEQSISRYEFGQLESSSHGRNGRLRRKGFIDPSPP